MATWKSDKIEVKIDDHDNYVECDSHWEYQTTADVFSYYETVKKHKYGYIDREIGDQPTKILIGPDTAKNLYHALANWMKYYNNEKQMMDAITDNIFERKDD